LHLRLTWLAAVVLLASCTTGEISSPIGEDIPAEPTLQALEAYRGNDQYLLRYRRGEDTYYVAGDLKGRTPLPEKPDDFQLPDLALVEHERPSAWVELTRDLAPIPIMSIDDWAAFRDVAFAEFLPTTRNTGVAVSFGRGDYFFFYDRDGLFRARRLIDKPPWYRVVGRVSLEPFFEKWQPQLREFLEARGLDGREVLFNTGDLDKGAIPFIYVNLNTRLIVLMRYDEIPDNLRGALPGTHLLQSVWHFVGSHTYSVPMRPFSSLKSLMALVTDTAIQSGKSLVPPIPPPSTVPPLSDKPPMDLTAWEEELDRRLGRTASRGKLTFLVDGEAFFTRFVDEVTSAQDSVDLRAYIFDNDDVALTIAELLKRRSREGIDVRVLLDGMGTIMAAGEHPPSMPEDHKAPMSIQSHLEQGSRVKVRAVKNTWLAGDHVKTMVIDRRVAFMGGMNIGREYRYDWHDLMVELTGPVVDEINREFHQAWAGAGFFGDFSRYLSRDPHEVNQALEGYPLRLIYTRPGQQEIYKLQRDAIRRSNRYIYIENAYFTDDSLLRELIRARARGVDVRVIIPIETDRGLITRNIVLAANTLLAHGVRVYLYPGFTHAKAAIFDGWASVGSANLDRLSLKINQELNVTTSEPEAVQALIDTLFEPDFALAEELTGPLPERWTDRLIETFGDYLF
jgi:phosphatidylserine/phosphatidylglycerophosphate/cardiolipin synthase-like enzyme